MSTLIEKKAFSIAAAKQIAKAAEAKARKLKVAVVISIFDDGANLLYLERMDGAPLGSLVVSQDKARSAVLFKFNTKEYESWLAGGLTSLLKLDALPFEGGVLIMAGGQILGAIGVSGGTAPQDGEIAGAGVASFVASLEKGS